MYFHYSIKHPLALIFCAIGFIMASIQLFKCFIFDTNATNLPLLFSAFIFIFASKLCIQLYIFTRNTEKEYNLNINYNALTPYQENKFFRLTLRSPLVRHKLRISCAHIAISFSLTLLTLAKNFPNDNLMLIAFGITCGIFGVLLLKN